MADVTKKKETNKRVMQKEKGKSCQNVQQTNSSPVQQNPKTTTTKREKKIRE